MTRYFQGILFGAILSASLTVVPARADDHHDHDRSYHDREHNDEHHWDAREDRAYRMWLKERHRKYSNFDRMREEDQRAYWGWRHDHSDAILKINIR